MKERTDYMKNRFICAEEVAQELSVSKPYAYKLIRQLNEWMMSGRLNSYLADIEEQAQERFERIVEQMKQAQGITERLKADNAWEWVGRMNNIQACAREIVDKEIIYQ